MYGQRQFISILTFVILSLNITTEPAAGRSIPIIVSPRAHRLEALAADELSDYLHRIYPQDTFEIRNGFPEKGSAILLGTPHSMPQLKTYINNSELKDPDSFIVTSDKVNELDLGIIAGIQSRGTLYAVYALLEKLGYGFYLSYETTPAPLNETHSFDCWQITDTPLIGERIIFNWHNFLSGCSTWSLADWKKWIVQASKMRFNTIMIHAYGNNPIFSFTHNGQTKPVGYLSTSAKGRDWGTQHVNDVRRIIGGEEIFDVPVFGAKAALVPDDQRVDAARRLMQQVFAFAENRGMQVIYAIDVDTHSCNPPNIIHTLSKEARFTVNSFEYANPDTPEGLDYYKSQITRLIMDYPQIDQLMVWVRHALSSSPLRSIKFNDFPESWKAEYKNVLEKYSHLTNDSQGPSVFVTGKIIKAYRKALNELGRGDVEVGLGTWKYFHFPAADALLPEDVKFIALDYHRSLRDAREQKRFLSVSENRQVVPIVWAHHDDHSYVGRPYTPFNSFNSLLKQNRCSGYGIIHWTTRPLDLYFKSLAEQVWQQTQDRPLMSTCLQMAERSFGHKWRDVMGRYLYRWVVSAPLFGRETTGYFIREHLSRPEWVIDGCYERLSMLAAVDEHSLDKKQAERFRYFKMWERWVADFYANHAAYERSEQLAQKKDYVNARKELSACSPASVITQYAQLSSLGQITPGEKGVLVTLNTRWLPFIVGQRQHLRMESARFNYAPTQHDLLAQGRGNNTFYVDRKGQLWRCFGQQETGHKTFGSSLPEASSASVEQEVCRTGIMINKNKHLRLSTVMNKPLMPGNYTVHLLFADPHSPSSGQQIFNVTVSVAEKKSAKADQSNLENAVGDTIDIMQRTGGTNKPLRSTYPVTLQQAGSIDITINPVKGSAIICGVIIEPVD